MVARMNVIPALQYKDAKAAIEFLCKAFVKAKAAGAQIVREPVTQDYGGRDYTCEDPEGHIWSFGTYDPMAQ